MIDGSANYVWMGSNGPTSYMDAGCLTLGEGVGELDVSIPSLRRS